MTMNAAFLHLVVNHFPLIALLFAGGFLVAALVRHNRSFLSAALWITLIAGIAAIVTLQSGEAAEHLLEHVPGINSAAIEAHEESAKVALASILLCAGIALVILLGMRRWSPRFERGAALVLLVALLVAAAFTGVAAHKGGMIRHADELENRLPAPSHEE